jgi:hypothetical protein
LPDQPSGGGGGGASSANAAQMISGLKDAQTARAAEVQLRIMVRSRGFVAQIQVSAPICCLQLTRAFWNRDVGGR